MNFLKKIVIAGTITFSSMAVQAELLSTNWLTEGDSKATLDTSSGLEWLDLTETDGLSINSVSNMLSTNYVGWRLPTATEVTELISNHFSNSANSFSTIDELTLDWANHFGYTSTIGQSYGVYSENGGIYMAGAYARTPSTGFTKYLRSYNIATSVASDGVFLVSDGGVTISSIQNPELNNASAAPINQVPTPASLGLLALAMTGIVSRRKNKNKTG